MIKYSTLIAVPVLLMAGIVASRAEVKTFTAIGELTQAINNSLNPQTTFGAAKGDTVYTIFSYDDAASPTGTSTLPSGGTQAVYSDPGFQMDVYVLSDSGVWHTWADLNNIALIDQVSEGYIENLQFTTEQSPEFSGGYLPYENGTPTYAKLEFKNASQNAYEGFDGVGLPSDLQLEDWPFYNPALYPYDVFGTVYYSSEYESNTYNLSFQWNVTELHSGAIVPPSVPEPRSYAMLFGVAALMFFGSRRTILGRGYKNESA